MKLKSLFYDRHVLSLFMLVIFTVFIFSCSMPTMDSLIDEYNKQFIPSEEAFWIPENIKHATMDFESYKLKNEYHLSADTALFIIGGPRDCDAYTWVIGALTPMGTPSGNSIISANQVLELVVKKNTTNIASGKEEVIDCLKIFGEGPYFLRLRVEKGGKTKTFETKLYIN